VDPSTGLVNSIGWTPTQGRSPRFIALEPSQRFLYAANEQSDTVVGWRTDAGTGRLTAAGQTIRNASPVAILFAKFAS
jgi:6-phosphogluconolactonase (cycloisomerase 2 family)